MHSGRKPLIAGNWKMFHGGLSALDLAAKVAAASAHVPNVDLVIAPPFTALAAASTECDGTTVAIAAQNLHTKPQGAFTGEVSGPMLKESGCTWVIVGHSERRQYCAETDDVVADKVAAAFASDLLPIVCVGETLAEREADRTLAVVERQIAAFLPHLASSPKAVAIAYEPVWAIGTGRNAGPDEAEEVHHAIRRQLEVRSPELAQKTRILYGGSVKPDNARALLAQANVDGALVGGASLDAGSFGAIAMAAEELARSVSA